LRLSLGAASVSTGSASISGLKAAMRGESRE
jgi:hypothetical protein